MYICNSAENFWICNPFMFQPIYNAVTYTHISTAWYCIYICEVIWFPNFIRLLAFWKVRPISLNCK
jgi:hypothetical protein